MAIHQPRKVVVTSGATLVNEVIYPYPCVVHSIHVTHNTGGAAYVQIHDADTPPANGTVPMFTHSIESAKTGKKAPKTRTGKTRKNRFSTKNYR